MRRATGLAALALAAALTATAPVVTAPTAAPDLRSAAVLHAFEPPEVTPLVQAKLQAAPAVAPQGAPDGTSTRNASFAKAAAALPLAKGSPSWRAVGPRNITAPAGYSQAGERFAPVSGLTSALVVDPSDTSGNTVYQGNYGGLWRSTNGGATWQNLTDGWVARTPVGAVAIDPADPQTLYIGTGIAWLSADFGGAGVYVSHDRGRTWSRPAKNTSGYGVLAIAVSRGGGVFVGTTDGLFRSTDRGASFTDVQLPTNAAHTGRGPEPFGSWVTDVVVKPNSPLQITAAVGFPAGRYKNFSLGNGLYRSTTGGAQGSWTYLTGNAGLASSVASTDPLGRISLAYGTNPDAPDVLWALVGDAGLLVGDGTKGLPTADVPLVGTASNLNGAFRSADDGATWTTKGDVSSFAAAPNSTIASLTGLGYGPGVQAWYNNWIKVDPSNPDRVFVGLEEVYESVANTSTPAVPASWTVIERYADLCGFLSYTQGVTTGASCPDGTPLYGGVSTHPDQHSVAAFKTAAGVTRLYTGNDGGVFRQDAHVPAPGSTVPSTTPDFDNDSWVAVNTPATTLAYHAARLPDGSTIAGLQDNGTTKTLPTGQSYEICGGDGFDVGVTPNPLVFYCSYVGDRMYVTTDGGRNITDIDPDLTGAAFSAPFSVDPIDANHLIAAGQDVKVDVIGPNVQVVKDPILGTVVSNGWLPVFDAGNSESGKALAASATALYGAASYVGFCGSCQSLSGPATNRAVVATNVKPGCAATKATSACWHKATGAGLPNELITKIVIDPKNTSTIYVTVSAGSGEIAASLVRTPRVLVSHDAGEHFSDLSGNLPTSGANSVVLRAGKLYVATDDGVFVGGTAGKTWQRFGTLPKVSISDLRQDVTGRYLTAATYGRGAYEADLKRATITLPGSGGVGTPGKGSNGGLAATGGPPGLAAAAALLLLLAGVSRRLRRRARD